MRPAKPFLWILALGLGVVSGVGVAHWLAGSTRSAGPETSTRASQSRDPVVSESVPAGPNVATSPVEAAVTRLAEVVAPSSAVEAETAKTAREGARPRTTESASLKEAREIAARLDAERSDPVELALAELAAVQGYRTAQLALAEVERAAAGDAEDEVSDYASRLEALGPSQDPRTLAALAPALADPSEQVRSASLRALRHGAAKASDAPVLGTVRQLAAEDPDPRVQREAFEVFARWGDEREALAMAQALGRSPGPLQQAAVREWIRLEREIAEREAGLDALQLRQARR